MTAEEKFCQYARRSNLTAQDVEFVLGLLGEEREACARMIAGGGLGKTVVGPLYAAGWNAAAAWATKAIRARGVS